MLPADLVLAFCFLGFSVRLLGSCLAAAVHAMKIVPFSSRGKENEKRFWREINIMIENRAGGLEAVLDISDQNMVAKLIVHGFLAAAVVGTATAQSQYEYVCPAA